MKKTLSFALMLILLSTVICSCVEIHRLDIYGIFESENPNMKIYRFHYTDEKLNPDDYGVITNEDGSETKIVFMHAQGHFYIYDFRMDGGYGPPEGAELLYEGECRQKDDTIVLTEKNGNEIVLKKTEDLPEHSKDYYFKTDEYTKDTYGVFENNDYGIKINIYSYASERYVYGEILNKDNSKTKTVFLTFCDTFWICEYQSDGSYSANDSNILFQGKYIPKGDSIELNLNDGEQIVLNKVSELSDGEPS